MTITVKLTTDELMEAITDWLENYKATEDRIVDDIKVDMDETGNVTGCTVTLRDE